VRGIALGVALVVMGLYFVGLSAAPFIDPPEGFHAEVAQQMMTSGDFVTLRANGVRYFDKPPLLYWLMTASFDVVGPTPFAARLWSALAAVGVAAVTARIGVLLGGPRLGLLAGLMVAANLGMFLYGRIVKPDMVFILCIMLAYAGFVLAYQARGRWSLSLFYGGLGLAMLAKDLLGAVGPLLVIGLFFWLTRERPLTPWVPWWGVAIAAGISLPWYLLVEARNHGFLWYTIVDNHVLNLARQRVFPDEDVPLGALEFLAVTLGAFLPWALALPWAVRRTFRRPWEDATSRLWLLFGLWALVVIGFFTVSPFKLPHYGLPAFPALALLVARVWDETLDAAPGSPRPRSLTVPLLMLFGAAAGAFWLVWSGILAVPTDSLASLDVGTRNRVARGQVGVASPLDPWLPILLRGAVITSLATVAMAVAVWRRAAAFGVGIALATTIAFLPAVGAEGMAQFARARSLAPVADGLLRRLRPGDIVAHEGPIENGATLLLRVTIPVRIVNGRQSNLAFGATFPEAREAFWDSPRLEAAWDGRERIFLVTGIGAARSVVRALPPERLHLLAQGGGRRLFSNLAD